MWHADGDDHEEAGDLHQCEHHGQPRGVLKSDESD